MSETHSTLGSWDSGELASLAPTHASSSLPDALPGTPSGAAPFATDPAASPMFPGGPSTSGRRLLERQRAAEPVVKVGSCKFGTETYEQARQAAAAARRAGLEAGKPPPFARREGEGGVAAAGIHEAHYLKPHSTEPSAKITEPGKGWAWDQQAVEEACRQRAEQQAAARKKAWGTPGLLG